MSVFSSFNEIVSKSAADTLTNYVLPTLSFWLKSHKNVDVSVHEMLEALKVETTVPIKNTNFIGVNMPVVPPDTAGRKKAVANNAIPAATATNGTSGTCIYESKRKTQNKNKGDLCGLPNVSGYNYCKSCLYKKGGGGVDKPAKGATASSGLSGVPQMSLTPVVPPSDTPKEEEIIGDTTLIPGYVVIPYKSKYYILSMDYLLYAEFQKENNSIDNLKDVDAKTLEAAGLSVCTDQNVLNVEFANIRNILGPAKSTPITVSNSPVNTVPTNSPVLSGVNGMQNVMQVPMMQNAMQMPMGVGMPTMPMNVGVGMATTNFQPMAIPSTMPNFAVNNGFSMPSIPSMPK